MMVHFAQRQQNGFRFRLLDAHIIGHPRVFFGHKGLPCIGKPLCQKLADPFPGPVRVCEDNDAPLFVRCFNLL